MAPLLSQDIMLMPLQTIADQQIKTTQMNTFSLYDYYKQFSNEEVHLAYQGAFDSHTLASLSHYVRAASKKFQQVQRRVFFIFMELAQNIAMYSAEQEKPDKQSGKGIMMLRTNGSEYIIHSGNSIDLPECQALKNKLDYINSLDREALRRYKRQERAKSRGDKGNAHIGLIEIALSTSVPLAIQFTPIDDQQAFYELCTYLPLQPSN